MPIDKELNIQHLIESQRGHHTATGNVYYWDVANGDDANDGLSPSTSKQTWGGVSGINSVLVAFNHDAVIILPGEDGNTIITEQIIIDKEYTFIRGPGRDVVFKPTATTGETISMESEGGELSGVRIETADTGDGEALVVNGDFCFIHDIWVEASQGDGIRIQNVTHSKIKDVMVRNCSGNAIVFRGTNKICKYNIVSDARILENAGHGILFTGANCTLNYVWGGEDGVTIMANTGWGVTEESGADFNHLFGPTIHIHANVAGEINFTGSESGAENVTQWATKVVQQVMAGEVTTTLALARKIYGIANANTEYEALVFDTNHRATQFRIVAFDTNDFGPGSGDTAVEVERWLFEAVYNSDGTIFSLTVKEGL